MTNPKKLVFLLLVIAIHIYSQNLSFDVYRRTSAKSEFALEKSDLHIKNLMKDVLKIDTESGKYAVIDVYVYDSYYVTTLFSATTYQSFTYRVDPQKDGTYAIQNEYVDEEIIDEHCAQCPNEETEILLTACFARESHISRRKVKEAYDDLIAAGVKNIVHLEGQDEATPEAVLDYLSCKNLKYWGRIGHGSKTRLSFSGSKGGSISASKLGEYDLTNKFLILNVCMFHNSTTKPDIIDKANAYLYAGGDNVNLEMNRSEYAFHGITVRGITQPDTEFGALIMEESEDHCSSRNQYGYTRNNDVTACYWNDVMKEHVTVGFPNGGEELERNSTYTFKWFSNVDGNVKVEIFKGTALVKVLAASANSSDQMELAIDATYAVGNDYTLKVTHLANDTLIDISDKNFSITEEFIIDKFVYFENFDTLQPETQILPYKYEQLTSDDNNWTVLSGPTPSRIDNPPDVTGSKNDHTTGGSQGNYIYTEASTGDNGNPDKTFTYVTPKFNLNLLNNPTLSYWYHMFSDNAGEDHMGELSLDISVDGVWKEKVVSQKGNKGDTWLEEKLDLTPYKGNRVIFRFRAITGDSWESDICIDDIKIDGNQVGIGDVVIPADRHTMGLTYYGSRIHYTLGQKLSPLFIAIYTMQGKLIKVLASGPQKAGRYSIPVSDIASGLYLIKMQSSAFTKTLQIIYTQ